jgi:group I intron endonuclease
MLYISANGKEIIGEKIDNSMKYSGIYALINHTNNKIYIGKSANISKRVLEHFSRLNNNKHANYHLQNSFNKYDDSFVAISLEKCEYELLDDKERFFISYYETKNQNYGYNMTDGGEGLLGYRYTEETKLKMSKSAKIRGFLPETHKKAIESISIPVVQLGLEGNLIKRWNSAHETTDFNFNGSNIGQCCKKQRVTHKGFIWLYESEYLSPNYSFDNQLYKKSKSKSIVKKPKDKKVLLQLTLDNIVVNVWKNAMEADRFGNFSNSKIYECLGGKIDSYKGFLWKYQST